MGNKVKELIEKYGLDALRSARDARIGAVGAEALGSKQEDSADNTLGAGGIIDKEHLESLAQKLLETGYYKEGGKIHIKPENRGKFTALKKRTGHSASWFKAHGTPAQKKMAIFALNARKWKHADGGFLHTYADGGDKPKLKRVDIQEWFDTEGNRGRAVNVPAMEQMQDSLIARGWGLPQRLAVLATAAQEMDKNGAASRGVGGNGYLGYSASRMPVTYLDDTPKGRGEQIHFLLDDLTTLHSDNWLDGGAGGPKIMSGKDGYDQFWGSDNVYNATMLLNKSNIRPAGREDSWKNRANVAKAMQKHLKKDGGLVHTYEDGTPGEVIDAPVYASDQYALPDWRVVAEALSSPEYIREIKEKQPWFVRASLGAMMADAPAVATASGWTQDNNGNIVQTEQDSEGARQLRDNLAVLGVTAMTAPVVAAAASNPTVVGQAAAKALQFAGDAGMPSTYLKGAATYFPKLAGFATEASPWLDAGALAAYSGMGMKDASRRWKEGNKAAAVAEGILSTFLGVAPSAAGIRDAAFSVKSGVKNLKQYKNLLSDSDNYIGGLKYAQQKYQKRADLLDYSQRRALGEDVESIAAPKSPRIFKRAYVLDELPEYYVRDYPLLGVFSKNLGKYNPIENNIMINPYHKKLLGRVWKGDVAGAIRDVSGTMAHEGTHWALTNLNATGLGQAPTKIGEYYTANKYHPLYDELTWRFDDMSRDLSRYGSRKHQRWMRSPEEFVAEMTKAQYLNDIPTTAKYPSWDLDASTRINKFLGERFGFNPDEAEYITRGFSDFGF